ncbi:MAG: hypothetical protein AAFY41_00335 [Bacteroidota bacterium]
MKKVLILLVTMSTFMSNAQQDETDISSYSITVNPAFFALGGYSVKGFYHLPKNWSVGVAFEAGFELPDFARDQFFNSAEELTVDWDFLIGTEVRYRFYDGELDKGWYILGTAGFEGWTILDDNGNDDPFENWYASLGLGCNWYPFKKPNLHLGASYNVVFILNNTNKRIIGANEYNINTVVPPSFAPTIHLGWRF